jgi:ABC-2 type transport system ATP-binding protein
VRVRTPHVEHLTRLLEAEGATVSRAEPDLVSVKNLAAPRIAEVAAGAGVVVYELTPATRSLEESYLALTQDDVEFPTAQTSPEVNR